jgi:transposase
MHAAYEPPNRVDQLPEAAAARPIRAASSDAATPATCDGPGERRGDRIVSHELHEPEPTRVLRTLVLPPASLQRIEVALAIIDEVDRQLVVLERELVRLARRQIGCQALMRQYGVGPITATTVLYELGDVTRLSASRKAVRCSGLDIGVYRSDRRSRTGRITRQGAPALRWALYEAAQAACKPCSPDHADYVALKARGLSHTRASLTIARKLARRSYHILRELGPDALTPIA